MQIYAELIVFLSENGNMHSITLRIFIRQNSDAPDNNKQLSNKFKRTYFCIYIWSAKSKKMNNLEESSASSMDKIMFPLDEKFPGIIAEEFATKSTNGLNSDSGLTSVLAVRY